MNENGKLNSELTIISLIFISFMLITQVMITQKKVRDIRKELISTKNVVYYVSDKLDNTIKQIDELNEVLVRLKNELYGLKEFKRITKELR